MTHFGLDYWGVKTGLSKKIRLSLINQKVKKNCVMEMLGVTKAV